jgi:hypothetical protein
MAATVFGVAGLALFLLGVNTVIYFATGSDIGSLITGKHGTPSARNAAPAKLDATIARAPQSAGR